MQISLDSVAQRGSVKKGSTAGSFIRRSTENASSGSDLMQKSSSNSLAQNEKKSHKLSKKASLLKGDSYFSSRDQKLFNDAVQVLRDEQMDALNSAQLVDAFYSWELHPSDQPQVLRSPVTPPSSNGTPQTDASLVTEPILNEFKNVELIERFKRIHGALAVTQQNIYFIPAYYGVNQVRNMKKIPLKQIQTVLKQRFVSKETALEIFLFEQHRSSTQHSSSPFSSLFFKFSSTEERQQMATLLKDKVEDITKSVETMSALWTQGCISNFDYLLFLNQRAGRSFHDISQYPIFPWILSDYESEHIDLSDPSVYRDLSKPVGALNEERLQLFVQRSKDCEQPYLYSTHYSTPGYVAFFLVRTQPELLLNLHNGKYDVADRLFRDVGSTFKCSLTSQGDVKELIPEFFLGDGGFLRNVYDLSLGKLQHQEEQVVDDVILPPWAANPQDFVRLHREALESPHVSRTLHHWIDLIFGFQQLPQYGAQVNNTFPPYMHQGVNCLIEQEDLDETTATLQVYEFGQMPRCLFPSKDQAHPDRVTPLEKAAQRVAQQSETIENLTTQVTELHAEVGTLQKQLTTKTQQYEELEQKSSSLTERVTSLEEEVQTQKIALQEKDTKMGELEEEVAKWKKASKKPAVKMHLLPDQVVNDINGSEKVTIRKYTHNLENEVKTLLKKNDKIKACLNAEKEKNHHKEVRMTKLREEYEDYRMSCTSTLHKAMRVSKTERTSSLESENDRLREELKKLNLELELLRSQTQDVVVLDDFALHKNGTVEPVSLSPQSPRHHRLLMNGNGRASQKKDSLGISPRGGSLLSNADSVLKSVLDKTPIELPHNYDEEALLSMR